MGNTKVFSLDEIRQIVEEVLTEGSQEFSPKLGVDISAGNKKVNSDGIQASIDNIKRYTKDMVAPKGSKAAPIESGDKTMLNLRYQGEVPKEFKEKVLAQAEGYTSVQEKENGIEKEGDTEKNKEIIKATGEYQNDLNADRMSLKKSGLAARELPDKFFNRDTDVFNETTIKRLNFKKTTFLNEEHMLSKVPVDYRVDGMQFKMKDKDENEYLVEWVKNESKGVDNGVVVDFNNKKIINEKMDRIHMLFNYDSSVNSNQTTLTERKNVDKTFDTILTATRELTKTDK